ncbi:UDP-N-acetylglucosamine 4,6-dehydratase (inverting) [Pseudomonadota bacterium]|jgi:UDP-N-acetylglucosamine 4,6-dehydratase|nr:UDP-N-acetylglucosamine 4,6-dehydratase (inverting) [Pseudomonadota bacterium]
MNESLYSNKSILITGGTGSFGKEFVKNIIDSGAIPKRLIIFSRDELKQFEMAQTFSESEYPFIRYFIGDVRDKQRLSFALEGVDYVVHAAALKQVPAAEYNPFECIKTNVLGAQNLIEASMENNVKKICALSTDKAASPINLYGATKLCSDKLFVASNNTKGARNYSASVVRYGNVMGSRGSVIPFFLKQSKEKKLTITDERMTRFNITLSDGVKMVNWAIENSLGGEIFVPKIPSYNIMDLASAVSQDSKKEIVGIRPGEKLHEEMISVSDAQNTVDLGSYYAILPGFESIKKEYSEKYKDLKFVDDNFSYNSGTNPEFLSIDELKKLLKDFE